MEVVDAAAHLEEVERIVHELLGGDSGDEGTVENGASAEAAEARGDGGARVFVFKVQLYQRCEAKAQAVGICFRERATQDAVEQESGLEVGSGGRVLDRADTVAQVELLRAFLERAEQTLQAAAEVGGLADVGLGVGIFAAQEEDSRGRGDCGEDLRISLRDEFQALGQHEVILVRN